MTEDEAKTKWCPQSFAPAAPPVEMFGGTPVEVTRRHAGLQSRCIGSVCMAWRTRKVSVPNRFDASSHEEDRGFCGLAGKP